MSIFGFKKKEQKKVVIPELVNEDCNATEETFRKAEEIKNLPPEELAKLLKELLHKENNSR